MKVSHGYHEKKLYAIPESYYVYEFFYPKEMPGGLADIVFYVGMGENKPHIISPGPYVYGKTHKNRKASYGRLDDHIYEAIGRRGCTNHAICLAILSILDAGLVVGRRIVFESYNEEEAVQEEIRHIQLHPSPYLCNEKDNKYKASGLPAIIEPAQEKPSPVIPIYGGPRRKKSN